jgi:hypothetical protein
VLVSKTVVMKRQAKSTDFAGTFATFRGARDEHSQRLCCRRNIWNAKAGVFAKIVRQGRPWVHHGRRLNGRRQRIADGDGAVDCRDLGAAVDGAGDGTTTGCTGARAESIAHIAQA